MLHKVGKILWCFLCTLLVFTSEAAISESSDIVPLKKGQGYLLVDLDVDGVAPSFQYIFSKRLNTTYKEQLVDLKGRDFVLLPIRKGHYQITRVNAPYYNLPYWLDTASDLSWSFTITEGKLNYVGKLVIGKKRGKSYVDVNLLNRIATDFTELNERFKDLSTLHPFVYAGGYQDDFLKDYNDKEYNDL